MMKRLATLLTVLLLSASWASAKEGMWIPMLLKAMNESEMQSMGMKLTAEDLYSINRSSLKDAVLQFGGGCTGELVSPKGLLLTNHHCGYSQIQSHSSVENDILKNGFWAKTMEDELPNPGLTATFIVRMEDVTDKVLAGSEKMDEGALQVAVAQRSKEISDAAVKGTHYEAFIRPFNYGNQYYMFVTETFRDVRLVGAPPSSIGKFGYDKDNWVWPRHTGDFSVFRIYAGADNKPADYNAANKPYTPKHYFPIDLRGVSEGDFTMVYGFPGRTEQYLPSYAIDYIQNVSNPAKIKMRTTSLSIIDADMASSDRIRIAYAAKQSRISNSYKKWQGQQVGLKELKTISMKQELEKDFAKLANQRNRKEYMSLVSDFERLYKDREKYELARDYFIELLYFGPEALRFSERFIQVAEDYQALAEAGKLKDEVARLKKGVPGFFKNYNQATDKKLWGSLNALYAEGVSPDLRPTIYETTVNGKYKGDYNAWTDYVYEKSVFVSEDRIMSLLNNFSAKSVKVIKKDPVYQLTNELYDAYLGKVRPARAQFTAEIDAKMKLYVKGMMELFPDKRYWADANSTLRVSYGTIDGSSPRDGMEYQPVTYLEGVMAKYIPGDRDYDVSDKLMGLYEKKDYGVYADKGRMPVCFTGANHTTGGNSGSPVINGDGYLIGINFDRSWESTMSDYHYDADICRNIAVDIRYVCFVIDKLGGCERLVKEMTLVDDNYVKGKQMEKTRMAISDLSVSLKTKGDIDKYMERAALYHELDNKPMALADYDAVLALDKSHGAAALGKAMVLGEMGKKAEATKAYAAAMRLNSKNANFYFQRGLWLVGQDKFAEALKDFDKSTVLDRSNYKGWYNRGLCLLEVGRAEEGCSDLKFSEQLGGHESSFIYRNVCEEN